MRTPLRLLGAVLAPLAMLAGGPATAVAAPAADSPKPPVLTRYTGSFAATLSWDQTTTYGPGEYEKGHAVVQVTGTIPSVRFADSRLLGSFGRGKLTTTGSASTTLAVYSGEEVTQCDGDSVLPATSVPPLLLPVNGKPTFYAFNSLSAPVTCVNSRYPEPFEEVEDFPAVPIPVAISAAQIGDKTIKVPFDRTLPRESCPDNRGGDGTCVYRLKGTLTLRQVPDIDIFRAPTRARLAGARASVVAGCSSACTATLTVRPLRGAGSVRVRESLRPHAPETLAVTLGKRLRDAVGRSGGARLELSYRSGGHTQTFEQRLGS